MKTLLTSAALLVTAALACADIQQPPSSDFGPTRKLGRGIGNICFGITELPTSMASVNYFEGNSAAFSYGIVRGLGRTFARLGYGVYDTLLFPFPTVKGTYAPPYRSNVQWIHRGYSEFPPELGFESRYPYVRNDQRDP
jgi:putative exosortase-associated protein (TIGR04073 family)